MLLPVAVLVLVSTRPPVPIHHAERMVPARECCPAMGVRLSQYAREREGGIVQADVVASQKTWMGPPSADFFFFFLFTCIRSRDWMCTVPSSRLVCLQPRSASACFRVLASALSCVPHTCPNVGSSACLPVSHTCYVLKILFVPAGTAV